ncbi:MAG: 4Fe-4S binding protein [Thermodesulfobacteriota bacterium]
MIGFRRAAQLVCLLIFAVLLAAAGTGMAGTDLFLRLDPVLVGIAAIAGRVLLWAFIPALAVVISAVLFGRIFCGYICPMGTAIDLSDDCFAPRKRPSPPRTISPNFKLYVLAFLIGAAVLGISVVFWAAPLALITRLAGTVIYPVVRLVSDQALTAFYPIADWLDLRSLMFLNIETRRFAGQFFILFFFAAVFAAVRLSPRFWCRYLCPSGALLAICSKKPLVGRRVGPDCNQCGKCVRNCPMDAIDPQNPEITRHDDCIVCKTCERICPEDAIDFSPQYRQTGNRQTENHFYQPIFLDRRRFLLSAIGGVGVAAVGMTGLTFVTGGKAEGEVRTPRLIRPPGALPEAQFLAACVRCGQCMTACPTNTLQPVWFAAGALGMFSPAIVPRRKYCDPKCTACGDVCPTGAIQSVSAAQRTWVKTGTAVIYRQRCLAWEYKKSCMVCDEVCPYDAVNFEKKPDLPHPVPHVVEDKCAGCGYCEHYCPVQNDAAIVVTAMNAFRLQDGDYIREAKNQDMTLQFRAEKELVPKTTPDTKQPDGYPSGETSPEGLPPGFDEGK